MRTIIKVVNKNYRTQKDLENLVGYVLRIKPSDRHHCSCGSFGAGTITAYEEMVKVQNFYGKTEDRLARHFIVSFDDNYCIDSETAVRLAYRIALYYGSRHQIIFGVHEDTGNIHIHFVLNTVSFVDGLKFTESPGEFARFKHYVENVVNEYEEVLNHY